MKYDHSKSTVPKNLVFSFALIITCCVLWGTAHDLTDSFVSVFQHFKDMTSPESSLFQAAVYGAYFCATISAAIITKKLGYIKATIIVLLINAIGAFLCSPIFNSHKLFVFLLTFYLFSSGCAILKNSVIPYILSMRNKETVTQLINLTQAFYPGGHISESIIGNDVILFNSTARKKIEDLGQATKAVSLAKDLSYLVNTCMIVVIISFILGLSFLALALCYALIYLNVFLDINKK